MSKARSVSCFILGVGAGVLLAALAVPLATGHRAVADETGPKAGSSQATASKDDSNRAAWDELRQQMDRQDARRRRAHHGFRGGPPAWARHGYRSGWQGWGHRGSYWAQQHHRHGPGWAQYGYRGGPPAWGQFRGPYWAQHRRGPGPYWAHHDRHDRPPPHGPRGMGGFQFAQRGQPVPPGEGQRPTGLNVMRRLDQLEQKLDSLFREVSALRSESKR